MSLFEEAKRKVGHTSFINKQFTLTKTLGRASAFFLQTLFLQAEQLERRRKQEHEGGSRGPAVRGRARGEDGARVEIWIRPSGQAATPSSQRGGSESSRDSEQDGELGSLSASDVSVGD